MLLARTGFSLAVSILLLSGCAGPGAAAAAAVATRFVHEASTDPAAACRLLAPATLSELEQSEEKRCAQALPGLGIDPARRVMRTQAFGADAQVALRNQTVFLSRFDQGWRVVAAGCTGGGSDQDIPYECPLKGR